MLLLNLGTPDSPDYWPMRRYLGEFLSDRRVIETNPLLWQLILQGIILNVAAAKERRQLPQDLGQRGRTTARCG